ncbi:PREDICTED: putative pentatricopeptide repeat-containing protein At3g15200 [Theobroma cacao]|uniref:Pentatricopeptide repeat-containing protein At3g15200 n=1 Tax=Theobroma cacao TaxID=3641 RepID=A0AB32UY85_THECC|nr:PREDICTED: putative pentatricopeptide repeat-containing protein At3g15200 [Theobroma cacao]
MRPIFKCRSLNSLSRGTIHRKFKFPISYFHFTPIPRNQATNPTFHFLGTIKKLPFFRSFASSGESIDFQQFPDGKYVLELQNILNNHRNSSIEEIEQALDQCEVTMTEGLALDLVRRNRSDWKLAHVFFQWVSKKGENSLGFDVYNEILDVLGKMHRFEELRKVFDEMLEREGLVNEGTFKILLHRYAAADKVEDAMGVFNRRKEFGFKDDVVAFQVLLMCLCRYKHVEFAETLYQSKRREFGYDIKTMNIILNGWCVLGNVHEARRFWKDIIESKCKPDLFTYGTFINALTKKGKLGTAMKLFRGMWEEGCDPDVVICNCVIDALCFKKRIPEALELFREMGERGCVPNVVTYNSLIKHLCKIRRMEKVYEILDEMEEKGGCLPNDVTFNYLLKSLKKPEEVPGVLERMERYGCNMSGDTYNLILKLYMKWGHEERVRCTWDEMEKSGLGPDRRSYTIMIHGLYDKGSIEDALSYFNEMTSKGMVPEPRTEILVNAMKDKLKEQEGEKERKEPGKNGKSLRPRSKRRKEKRTG